jgi:N-dimethylarginine dimethylaminohydrolase
MKDDITRRDFVKATGAAAAVAAAGLSLQPSQAKEEASAKLLPLRQKTEFGTLREVILGRTEEAAFPPKSKANANFTDHVADLGPSFYDKYKEGERIPFAEAKPELVEAYDQLHNDLTKAYESEGVRVQRINLPTKEIVNYWAYAAHGYWPATLASLWQIFGNVVVEMIVSDNILECAPAGFAARELFTERFENDPNAIWLSLPASMPVDRSQGAGPGPFMSGGDIRIIDEKTVFCGCAWEKGKKEPAASNPAGAEVLRRVLRPFGYEVHQINTDADFSFHFDFVFGLIAPGVVAVPKGLFLDGIPKPIKDWDIIWVTKDDVNQGACNIVPLGPDASGQHRVVVPKKTPKLNDEIAKRGIKPVPVEVELGARNGGAIRCATLVTNRAD